jgi:hypothetical protein
VAVSMQEAARLDTPRMTKCIEERCKDASSSRSRWRVCHRGVPPFVAIFWEQAATMTRPARYPIFFGFASFSIIGAKTAPMILARVWRDPKDHKKSLFASDRSSSRAKLC